MEYPKDLELFTCHPYRSKRLAKYFADMSKDNSHVLCDDNVKDVLKAQGFEVDEAPRSLYSVQKLYEALSTYAPGKIQNPQPGEDLSSGIALAYKCFARRKDKPVLHVLPFTTETIVYVTSNPTGSPGLTNYGCTKVQSITRALERGLQTLRKVKQPEPCLAFKRTQFNEKTRLVWGYPYSMTAIEGLIAKPINEEFKKGCTPMAFGMSSGALGTKLRVSSYHKEWAYSLDMSKFDSSLCSFLIHKAFEILRTWYDQEEIEPVSGCTVRQIFDLVEYYFIHTTIVMPNGKIYIGKDHGVPSGSYFTQIVDSIGNTIIAGSISFRFSLNVAKDDLYVLGDDLLFWSNRKISLSTISNYVMERFHVKVHDDEKSQITNYTEPVRYVGRVWTKGVPDIDEEGILQRMIYPESWRKYSKDEAEKKRQVHMLLLSYAAVYRSAWKHATAVIDPNSRNIHNGCSNYDVYVYLREKGTEPFNPNFLSGLERYRRKYLMEPDSGDIPITATQFWL